MAKEIAEEYASSLADLTVNSKPLINMLTILAEENIDHAGTIVETVEKHLEKVNPDVKLPVLYLVDSIIKNVGGAYIQKFSQSIVNMFTRTFRQVDEKIRSQMFKLRETWHEVFPPTKLYQLDVKVNLVDPAWPIQAQPHQSNIHVNPNFLKKPAPTSSSPAVAPEDDEKMRSILAKKEQELLMLQKKKVEMELEQMRRQLELEKVAKKQAAAVAAPKPAVSLPSMPVALVNPVVPTPVAEPLSVPVKQRLGPPVNKPQGRIAPVSAALIAARRDPRLARHGAPSAPIASVAQPVAPPATIAPNVFDIKPLEHVTKRKNVITIDVCHDRAQPAPRRRDPRLDSRRDRRDKQQAKQLNERERDRLPSGYIDKIADARKISKLPPIPKINREERVDVPITKRKKDVRERRKRPERPDKDESSGSSPEKKLRNKKKLKELDVKPEVESEPVPFKELKNYHKERYMRRNRDKSESPEPAPTPTPTPAPPAAAEPAAPDSEPSSVPEAIESKDVDLRVLPGAKAAVVAQKRPSTETLEGKAKKNKVDKFDILFGNEDVDLRQLPQVDEIAPTNDKSPKRSPKKDIKSPKSISDDEQPAPEGSPKKDWHEVKEKDVKKAPSKLDLVRAKLAEATKGKDRLGRPLLFSKSPSVEKERERRRTISFEDTDMRNESGDDFDAEDNKKTISIIMSQAKEQFKDGQLDKNQYNALMYQVLQLNEKLKLKEAKQRESLEVSKLKLKEAKQKNRESLEASKRKLKALDGENKVPSPKSSPNNFGDIDERVVPSAFVDTPPDSQPFSQDFDMRTNNMGPDNEHLGPPGMPNIPNMPMFGVNNVHGPNQFGPMWRGPRSRMEEFGPRRFRGPVPAFFRGKTRGARPPFERLPIPPPLPTPQIGICQGECPLKPYERAESPPPLGAPGFFVPPTDYSIVEYIDQDPVKTIQIDGVPREIRFYDDTAVIMLDWDDPREIKFLPGSRRVTFDNKDSVVLSFNEGYKQVEIEDQVFDIKFGAPTRELYINGRWHECFFGGSPLGVIISGKPRLVNLEGPLPQVDIGKEKRTDLVAGKINLIVNATQMCPVYLDAKVQKFIVDNQVYTIRFVDALRTVLINEQPFKVEYGDLPKPIFIGNGKHFVRFSALPRNVKPGFVQIANMEGVGIPTVANLPKVAEGPKAEAMEVEVEEPARPVKTPSPDAQENQGLDILASVMPPSSMEFASGSDYSVAEPLFPMTDKKIPGLETSPVSEKPGPINLPGLGNINVTDLFAKLVATGIVMQPPKENKEEEKKPPKVDSNKITRVDMLQPHTMRGPQPGYVSKLYGGMQCSGCGSRFPPEQTVRYSQHLDWHFRQNRRERDSARRAHSRHWHYDLSDWLQYEEIDEIEDREKNWFETTGLEAGAATPPAEDEAPSVAAGAPHDAACAMCGDTFHQFYNEDKEEWHLRNSVKHDDLNYHPMCLDDYKASLAKEEEEEKNLVLVAADEPLSTGEPIEIKDVDETIDDQSDNESVVEVVDEKSQEAPLEIYDAEIEEESGDEDDVIYKAEPVEEVVVEDDADTDDETTEKRLERDAQAAIDFASVKIKQEPLDPDDEPIITAEEETVSLTPEPTLTTVHSSIDGNSTLASAAPTAALPEIRINISKAPIPSIISGPTIPILEGVRAGSMLEDISTDDEPLPPGEEVELQYKLKPSLEGVRLSRTPPEKKGIEESGLCSIM